VWFGVPAEYEQEQMDAASLGGGRYIGTLTPRHDNEDEYKLCLQHIDGGGKHDGQGRASRRWCWSVRLTSEGSSNYVYTIEGSPGALLRVHRSHYMRDLRMQEIENNYVLANAGLSPAVYATVFLRVLTSDAAESIPERVDDSMVVGMVMERYEASLASIGSKDTAKIFQEHNIEDALVDLFARAAVYVRCVDTKPANVVWKLDDGKPILRLIDVDPEFCGSSRDEHARLVVVPFEGSARVEDLRTALGAQSKKMVLLAGLDRKARVPALLVAAMSLLVLCVEEAVAKAVEAAKAAAEVGSFPYVRIAEALLEYHTVIDNLLTLDVLAQDKATFHMLAPIPETRFTTLSMLVRYCSVYRIRADDCDWQGAIKNALSMPKRECMEPSRSEDRKDKGSRNLDAVSTKRARSDESALGYGDDRIHGTRR
jgi:hypothetical protein